MKSESTRDDSNEVAGDDLEARTIDDADVTEREEHFASDDSPAEIEVDIYPGDDDLPVEPAQASDTAGEGESSAQNATRTLRELLGFHLYERLPDGAVPSGVQAIPALLHPYGDLSRIRYDYPVCIDGFDPDRCAQPLSQIVDDVLAAAEVEGDEAEQMKRSIYRLESVMRSVAEREPGRRLSVVWEHAATSLLSTLELSGERNDQQRKHLAAAREALQTDGDLLSCSADTTVRLFTTLMTAHWRQQGQGFRDDVDTLIQRLQDVLIVDRQHSDEAMSPESLRESLGTDSDEFDAAAMSAIISESPHAEPLPAKRRKRIKKALSTMVRMQSVFDATVDDAGDAPFTTDTLFDDCNEAARAHGERAKLMLDLFKSIRIARLETSNGYRESLHDPFFAEFDARYLTAEEIALCPPVLLHLTRDGLIENGVKSLIDMMASRTPLKVLLSLDTLCASDATADEVSASIGWATRLSNMVMALGDVYVLQAPLSRFDVLRSGLLAGIRFEGPALFSVYTAEQGKPSHMATYLAAAAATESRAFPVFAFDPAAGATLAERMDVSANPQADQDWTSEPFRYRDANGEEQTRDVAFTAADFLYLDPRLARHFWCVTPDRYHEDMVPLGEFLEMDPGEVATRIPYILAVDEKSELTRVVVTRKVVSSALRCRRFWHNLRESGGIENSFANNLLAEEGKRLEEEMQKEIAAMEQRYVSQLEKDVGELTKEIIQRIASRLMLDDGTAMMAPPSAPAVAPALPTEAAAASDVQAADTAEEVAAVEVEEEDDDVLGGLDDAYIDTPLCTTCNECTQLNAQIFAYNDNKQAYVKDAAGGPYQDIVRAAELCPVHIVHPGKPKDPDAAGIGEWVARAARFN